MPCFYFEDSDQIWSAWWAAPGLHEPVLLFSHPKFMFLLLYCSLLLALAYFFLFSITVLGLLLLPGKVRRLFARSLLWFSFKLKCQHGRFWDLFWYIYISWLNHSWTFFPPVKYRKSLWERWLKCCSGAYWLFLSLGGHGQRSGQIPMKSFRKKRSLHFLHTKNLPCWIMWPTLFLNSGARKANFIQATIP